jgi:hypothetical protein
MEKVTVLPIRGKVCLNDDRAVHPLDDGERNGIVVAIQSVFLRLKNLCEQTAPIYAAQGFRSQSAGVIARNLSEEIERSIIQHCRTFAPGRGHADLDRFGHAWEVKICRGSRLTINQSKKIDDENYIVANYDEKTTLTRVWVLWNARDEFFSPRRPNSNARRFLSSAAPHATEILFGPPLTRRADDLFGSFRQCHGLQ